MAVLEFLRERLRPTWSSDDLNPVAQIDSHPWMSGVMRSTGEDPQFLLKGIVPAGWYMVELEMEFPTRHLNPRFYIGTGKGFSEAQSYGFLIRPRSIRKRLLWFPDAGSLRFDPCDLAIDFRIVKFRLVRVSERFAKSRMYRKLTGSDVSVSGQTTTLAVLEKTWKKYCDALEPTNHVARYEDWLAEVEPLMLPSKQTQGFESSKWRYKPVFSIILPVWNTPHALLSECINSVLNQGYPYWELCIADDASTATHIRPLLESYAVRDKRIKIVFRQENGHISEASNSALELATGDFVVLLDHDDLLASHALYMTAKEVIAHPTVQIIYSDEDKLDSIGKRCDPHFKPDFSLDTLYSLNYISHLGVYSRELVKSAGGFRKSFDGSQDYDLLLRCVARVHDHNDIRHIPHVLYHWRMVEGSTAVGHHTKAYAGDAGAAALQEHLNELYDDVSVTPIAPGRYRPRWPLPKNLPLVSLMIPTRDGYELLERCVSSILEKSTYSNFEILIIDNQSSCKRTLDYLKTIEQKTDGRVRSIIYDDEFNFSAINNFAAKHARGSVLGLLNNDIEIISSEWLEEMVSHALRPDIGCVGGMLYYSDDTIQHAGVVLGIGGVAGHSHKYVPRGSDGYVSRLNIIQNLSAVTAAAMLVRREIYMQVDGLNETDLKVAFNDVDFCMRVQRAGYRNLWTPFAEFYHFESATRGNDVDPGKRERFALEVEYMKKHWGSDYMPDPMYNQNLTRLREDFSLADKAEILARSGQVIT